MKYALVTGPTSGIGYHLAHECAKAGMPLVFVDHDPLKLKSVADEFRGTYDLDVHEIVADLRHSTSPEYIFEEVKKAHIEVGYLINNAGIGEYALVQDADPQRLSDIMMVNIYALTMITKLFLPGLVENKGKILNVASIAAFMSGPMLAVYFASKAYVLSFSETLKDELKKTSVTVTTLCPGATATEFGKAAHMDAGFFTGKGVASAEEVAVFGFDAMIKGRGVVVYGFKNKLMVFATRFLPRHFVTKLLFRA